MRTDLSLRCGAASARPIEALRGTRLATPHCGCLALRSPVILCRQPPKESVSLRFESWCAICFSLSDYGVWPSRTHDPARDDGPVAAAGVRSGAARAQQVAVTSRQAVCKPWKSFSNRNRSNFAHDVRRTCSEAPLIAHAAKVAGPARGSPIGPGREFLGAGLGEHLSAGLPILQHPHTHPDLVHTTSNLITTHSYLTHDHGEEEQCPEG